MDDDRSPTVPARRGWPLVAAAGSLLLFLGLTAVVLVTGGVDAFDTTISRLAVAGRTTSLTAAATAFTRLGSLPVVVAVTLLAAALLRRLTRRWSLSVLLLTSVACTAGVVYLVKVAVGRTRPSVDSLLGAPSLDFAFPSGHTADGGVALVLSALLVAATARRTVIRRTLPIMGLVLALTVGVTRVYLGYHWATDVIGGWLLAGTVVCIAAQVASVLHPSATTATSVSHVERPTASPPAERPPLVGR